MSRKLTKTHLQSLAKVKFWGAATSAHQVEGGNTNQWTVWEKSNAKKLAAEAETKFADWLPKWQQFKLQAQDPANYISAQAADHYNLYQQDFDLMEELNFTSFRFSIEWSRIEPNEGEWNQEEIEHYRQYLQELRRRGIEPLVTLWHWTMPTWFVDMGGLEKRSNLAFFARYIQKLQDELGDELSCVCVINEPNVYVQMSYRDGRWPPQEKSLLKSVKVMLNLKRMVKLTVKIMPDKQIGVTNAFSHVETADNSPVSIAYAKLFEYLWNYWLINRIKSEISWIGVNYYFTTTWKGLQEAPPNKRQSDYGWDMRPYNIKFVLEKLHRRYDLPIIITENGLADAKDQDRQWWISETMVAMAEAIDSGANIIGYNHWSLLDNFEWAEGFWPRFGLVEVDYKTMKRTIRPSARFYADVIGKTRLK